MTIGNLLAPALVVAGLSLFATLAPPAYAQDSGTNAMSQSDKDTMGKAHDSMGKSDMGKDTMGKAHDSMGKSDMGKDTMGTDTAK